MSTSSQRIARLTKRLHQLNSLQLDKVEQLLNTFPPTQQKPALEIQSGVKPPHSKDWPHAPTHHLEGKGTYIVTAGTLNKQHYFRSSALLDYLENELLTKAKQYHWQLEAWAIFSNHYHFVGHAIEDAATLKTFLSHLHTDSARKINQQENQPERKIWFNYWETELTFEKSYLSRLNYVHQNPVRHGLVPVANQYRWCSAAWFERTATRSQINTIYSFKTDRVKVIDDFEVQ